MNAGPRGPGATADPGPEPGPGEAWAGDAVAAAGPLDLLLSGAALGAARRFRPDSSLLRLGLGSVQAYLAAGQSAGPCWPGPGWAGAMRRG